MDTINYIAWVACVAAVTAIVQFVQRPLRRKNKIWIYALGFVIKGLAAVAVAYVSMAICNKLVWNLGYFPAAVYAALLCDSAADLIALIVSPLRKNHKGVMLVSVVMTAVFVAYGTVNMEIITPKEHTYTSDKIQQAHRFVFLSDLHYCSAQSTATVDKALDEIAGLKPDFVLLGGDITDEHTTAEEMRQIYNKLGDLGVPVYFVYGNHDRQGFGSYFGGPKYTREELENTIKGSGLKILRDEIAFISDDLAILGREDESEGDGRCAVSELPKFPKDAYVICVDHSPYLEDDIRATGADLQLSGHTHAGQFFPLQYVYRLGVNNIYGDYKLGDTNLYVSPGITGWYFPLRTVAHCNYEVITLEPRTDN